MTPLKLISADSHIVETPDWYTERVERKYRDRVPRIVKKGDGPAMEIINLPGTKPIPARAYIPNAVGQSGKDDGKSSEYSDTRPGAWDPGARLKDQETDGVVAEVLYPTIGMRLFGGNDPELRAVCFRAHNDRMGEFCAVAPTRLMPVAMLQIDDIPAAVAELERCARLGHRGAMISSAPPEERPYNSPYYDPLWAAASSLGMPISLHVLTGTGQRRVDRNTLSTEPLFFTLQYVNELQESLTRMIEGGVFERFPKLRVVTVESGIGWMLGLAAALDYIWKRRQSPLKRPPSEYVRENIAATFQHDAALKGNVLGGMANFMCGDVVKIHLTCHTSYFCAPGKISLVIHHVPLCEIAIGWLTTK